MESGPARRVIHTAAEFEAVYGETIEDASQVVTRALRGWLRTDTPHDVEDLVWDTMDRLCSSPPAERLVSARAHIATVARNLARDWLEKQTTQTRGDGQVRSLEGLPAGAEPAVWQVGTAEAALYRVLTDDLTAYMARTASADEFAVWQLIFDAPTRWVTHLTNREMAGELGRPKGSVDRWAANARRMARDFIRNYRADPGGGS
jgi:DNA-directed RNA polymerase specialized sigma24 family protein